MRLAFARSGCSRRSIWACHGVSGLSTPHVREAARQSRRNRCCRISSSFRRTRSRCSKRTHRFIESYIVGLNYEFGKELLCRSIPPIDGASYFRQFWDCAVSLRRHRHRPPRCCGRAGPRSLPPRSVDGGVRPGLASQSKRPPGEQVVLPCAVTRCGNIPTPDLR